MTARFARLFGGTLLVLFVIGANARAELSLFGSYWDNIARATAHNDASKVRQLIAAGNDPNELDDDGRTGLLVAATNGNLQIVAILLKVNAHMNVKDKLGNTPLHYAADRNHVDIAELLLDAGSPVDPENKNGMTPLMVAASRGNATIVDALLAKGANARKTDFTGRDAVSWAQEGHRPAVVAAVQRAAARH
jgi:uncharacterized protein